MLERTVYGRKQLEVEPLSTNGFYEKMCHPAFVRLSYYEGAVNDKLYAVGTPPEYHKRFLERYGRLEIHPLLIVSGKRIGSMYFFVRLWRALVASFMAWYTGGRVS